MRPILRDTRIRHVLTGRGVTGVVALLLVLLSSAAGAAPVQIVASGGLLSNSVFQGTFEIEFLFESTTADEDPNVGAYLATNEGTYTGWHNGRVSAANNEIG